MSYFPKRSATIPGAFGISRQTFREVDTLIRSLREGTREFEAAGDLAAQLLAKTSQAFVELRYRGPVDPRYRFAASGGIPIPRRSQRTYRGWRVKRRARGVWELYNEEKGAFIVEYGIGKTPARKPLQWSGVATLQFIQRTKFANRIVQETFGSLHDNKGRFRSFESRIAGSNIMGLTRAESSQATDRTRAPRYYRR